MRTRDEYALWEMERDIKNGAPIPSGATKAPDTDDRYLRKEYNQSEKYPSKGYNESEKYPQ